MMPLLRGIVASFIPINFLAAVIFGFVSLFHLPLKLKYLMLVSVLIFCSLGLAGYVSTLNPEVLRITLLPLVCYLFYELVRNVNEKKQLETITTVVFFVHLGIIIFSYFFDFSLLVRHENAVAGRITGVFGYDYVGFFLFSYLIMAFNNKCLPAPLLLAALLLSAFSVSLSGRFGLIQFSILLLFFLVSFNLRRLVLLAPLVLAGFIIFYDKFYYAYLSVFKTLIYIKTNEDTFSEIEAGGTGGYISSPLVLLKEYQLLYSPGPSLLPSSVNYVFDSGPTFIFLNGGIVIGFFFYLLFFSFLRFRSKAGLCITILFVLTDLKFRSAFSVFPMVWVLLLLRILELGSNRISAQASNLLEGREFEQSEPRSVNGSKV